MPALRRQGPGYVLGGVLILGLLRGVGAGCAPGTDRERAATAQP